MKRGFSTCLALLLTAAAPALAPARPEVAPGATTRPATTRASDARVAVAVLDFEVKPPAGPELGKEVGEVLVASLGGEAGIELLDRATVSKRLQEAGLNPAGVADAGQAARIGKLVGARLLITGKAFTVEHQAYVTAKLIGTETGLVEGLVVKAGKNDGPAELELHLAQRIAERLRTAAPKLLAEPDRPTDPLPGLKAKLAGRALPKVSVAVTDRRAATATSPAAANIGPAVDAELKTVLTAAGFTVVDGPADQAGVELAITGGASSDADAPIGKLATCSARIEISAVNRRTGQPLFADHAATRGVDLTDNDASKSALQKGGRELGIKLLQHVVDALPARGNPARQ